MKRILAILALAAAASLAAACAQGSSEQKAADGPSEEKELICGGYTDWRDVNEEDMTLYRQALDVYLADKEVCTEEGCSLPAEYEALDLAVPTAVATQVVAGMNYKFKSDVAIVTVFCPLPGQGDPEVSKVEKLK